MDTFLLLVIWLLWTVLAWYGGFFAHGLLLARPAKAPALHPASILREHMREREAWRQYWLEHQEKFTQEMEE